MDENKRETLVAIGYKLVPTCGNCIYSTLNGEWGTCDIHQYRHAKHTGDSRQLSINRNGCCPRHVQSSGSKRELHGFAEFWDPANLT